MLSAYQPLIDYLATVQERKIALSFLEIEMILDAALPPSAKTRGQYWYDTSNRHVRLLRASCWSAHLERRRGIVIFRRDTE